MTSTDETGAASSRGAFDLSSLAGGPAAASADGAAPSGTPGTAGAGSPAPAATGDTWVRSVTQQEFPELIQLSNRVPVVVSLGSGGVPASAQLDAAIGRAVDGYAGRLVLATVDTDREQAIAQAFRIQQVPAVVALLNGQPVPMFQGAMAEDQLRSLLDELLQLGVQHGVAGTVPPFGGAPEEAPVPPLHQEAMDAIDAGDFDGAAAAYRKALAEKPNDHDAATGLAHVELLRRTTGADLEAVRRSAAENPDSVDDQLAVADLDLTGGHVEDAFARLVALIGRTGGDDRETARARLVELYSVVGNQDPRVAASRQALARVLF
ncbi:co-chaperone YbbN [Arthrobacter halodurans]|uniref:Co-chaperone YbbN n=1 Tax=Arthrobacter halodurans TaxID=516699 RepID=A0ABV4UIZ6_9MICC